MSTTQDDLRACLAHEDLCKGQKNLPGQAASPTVLFLVLACGIAIGVLGTLLLQANMKPAALENLTACKSALPPYVLSEPPTTVPEEYFAAASFNNSCLLSSLSIPQGPQSFDACGFIVKATDDVWNTRGDVLGAIERYFHDDYLDAGSWGKRIVGKRALRDAILSEMRAFPDIQIHITDCVCNGNDVDGYKCAMPDILVGTNTGSSGYGPPTGRRVQWTGLVQSFIKTNQNRSSEYFGQWQFYGEWGVHDEWSLIQQLGLDFSRVPHPLYSLEELHDCKPLEHFLPWPVFDTPDRIAMGLTNPNSWR